MEDIKSLIQIPTLPAPLPAPVPAQTSPVEFTLSDEAFNDAVGTDPNLHLKAKNAHYSSAWIKGPGAVTLLVEAARDLCQVSEMRGEPATEIPFVRILVLPSTRTLLVWPTDDKDLQRIEVTWKEGVAKFLASDELRAAKIPVESGKKVRYNVHVLKQSKVGPALAIDMRVELETKLLPKKKSYSRAKSKKKAAKETPAVQAENEE